MAVLVKTIDGLAYASMMRRNGQAKTSIKNICGLDVTAAGLALISHTGKAGTVGGVTTNAIDTSGANFIILHVSWYGSGSAGSVSDNKGNTWTPLTAKITTNSASRLFYSFSPNVGTGHTFTASAEYSSLQVMAWSGIASSPFDVENGGTGTGGSLSTGSVTPSQASSVLITGFSDGNGSGIISIDLGFTITDTNPFSGGTNLGGTMAYKIMVASAATNPTWSNTLTSVDLSATIAVFKA